MFALAAIFTFAACGAQDINGSGGNPGAPLASLEAQRECSIVGRTACRAAAALSGNPAQAGCTATRSGASWIESCGTATTRVAAPTPAPTTAPIKQAEVTRPPASSVRLSWRDNSTDESSFVIERCDQVSVKSNRTVCAGSWKQVGSTPSNVTEYVDRTVTANQTYVYRIKAVNGAGSSGYTEEAAITAPAK